MRTAIQEKKDAERRAYYLQILGTLSQEDRSQTLLQALEDPAPLVALVAFRRLCEPEHAQFAPQLIDHLDRFEQIAPGLLASLLARLGFDALPALRQAFADPNRSPRVRIILAQTLSQLNDPQAATLAARILQSSSLDEELTIALLRLLTQDGAPAHQEVILRYLDHPSERIRAEAVRALGTAGDANSLGLLVQALQDASPWVAMIAARTLKQRQQVALLEEAATRYPGRRLLIEQVLHENTAPAA